MSQEMARSRRSDWRRKGPLLGVNRTKSLRDRIDDIDPIADLMAPPRTFQGERRPQSPRRRDRQVLADFCEELTWAKGLAEVSIATCGTGLVLIPAQSIGRDDDNGDGTERGIRLDPAGSLVAIH